MNDEQIKHMVNRFLGWKLPEHFRPDSGISFEPEFNKEWNAKQGLPPQRHNPTGTNLFDVGQAEAMVRYMLEGLPDTALRQASEREVKLREALKAALYRVEKRQTEFFQEHGTYEHDTGASYHTGDWNVAYDEGLQTAIEIIEPIVKAALSATTEGENHGG